MKRRRSENGRTDLQGKFMRLQKSMRFQLEAHEDEDHGPTKGDAHEVHWIKVLSKYLPNRYNVDQAFVIDCDGYHSEQIDVVIYDQQYSPFIFREDGRVYIPAESVYALLEVKQSFSKSHFEYAGKKAASVRRLKRTSAKIHHAGGTHPPKEHSDILAGILAFESNWSPPLGKSMGETIENLSSNKRLSIGCALNDGSFLVNRTKDSMQIERSSNEEAFVFFFLGLLRSLAKLGTVPAIDLKAYASALDSV